MDPNPESKKHKKKHTAKRIKMSINLNMPELLPPTLNHAKSNIMDMMHHDFSCHANNALKFTIISNLYRTAKYYIGLGFKGLGVNSLGLP